MSHDGLDRLLDGGDDDYVFIVYADILIDAGGAQAFNAVVERYGAVDGLQILRGACGDYLGLCHLIVHVDNARYKRNDNVQAFAQDGVIYRSEARHHAGVTGGNGVQRAGADNQHGQCYDNRDHDFFNVKCFHKSFCFFQCR